MKSQLHTHLMENNPESQGFLEENEQKFSDQCLKVYRLLLGGIRLSVVDAIGHGISSLPRRILDLKERNGITTIKDEWVKDSNGKRLYKVWYIDRPKPPTKTELVKKFTTLTQQTLF